MQKHLEQKVTETAAVVSDWQRSIASIETQFNTANLALANAKKIREANALKATMNDTAAIKAIQQARAEQLTAEQTIADLKIALPAAEAQLAEAQKAASSARAELGKLNAAVLMRQRADVGSQLDQVIAEAARLYRVYQELGNKIINMPGAIPQNMHGMMATSHEAVLGDRRVRAAVPKFLEQALQSVAHDEQKKENLATTEARFWNLTPVEAATTKAA